MTKQTSDIQTRRRFLATGITGSALLIAGCKSSSGDRGFDAQPPRPTGTTPDPAPAPKPTPVADFTSVAPPTKDSAVCVATADNIEGPFFKSGAPHRAVLVRDGMKGERLTLTGRVVTTVCSPIAGVHMEVWQADHSGGYDNRGYTFRGFIQTDKAGGFHIESIIPGRYLNGRQYRPAHIHFKLAAPGRRPLTTQLYFAGDPYNDVDPFIHRSLIMPLATRSGGGKSATFEFVLS